MIFLSSFILCAVLYLLLLGMKAGLTVHYTAADRAGNVDSLAPCSVTVAQPILSGDPGLSAMLESNLLSLSGQYFLWLCDETDHDAIKVVEVLIEKHPVEKILLMLCPACPATSNPKVFKLALAADAVTTPFFLVLDDDTHLPADSAAALVHHARSHDITTGLPRYRLADDLPSALLSQFVNNNSALTYLSTLPFKPPLSINGMCYVIKRESLGVFREIMHHLTDDLALATHIRNNGGTIHQSSHPQIISTRVQGLRHYVRLMHRWHLFALLLVKQQNGRDRALIGLLHGWHPLLLWALLLVFLWKPSVLLLIMGAGFLLARIILLGWLQSRIFGKWLHQLLVSLLSELLQPLHLLHALVDRRIVWRSRRYYVHASDHFESR